MASALVLVLVAFAGRPSAAADGDGKARAAAMGVRMPSMSFQRTLTYDDTLGNWLVSAGAMALRDRFQLLPPVKDRYGIFWNKKALTTSTFDVTFNLQTDAQPPFAEKDATVALWISTANFSTAFDEQKIISTSKDWGESLKTNELSFIGNSPKFSGLAVIFGGYDKKKAHNTVTAAWGDGIKIHVLPELASQESDQVKTVLKDWISPQKQIQVKVSVAADRSIRGVMRRLSGDENAAMQEEEELFKFPANTFPADVGSNGKKVYLGFSGYSGSTSAVEVNINSLEVTNFDTKSAGEEERIGELGSDERREWLKVLTEEKRFVTQLSQKDAIARLSKLLEQHVARYDQMGEKLKEDIVSMESRLDTIGRNMGNYLSATRAYSTETGTFDSTAVREHIVGIRSVLTEDHKVHDAKLHDVHEAAKDLKKAHSNLALNEEGKTKVQSVHQQSLVVQEQAHRGWLQTSFMLLILIVVVAVLGGLFLSRMRYYEKKHYI